MALISMSAPGTASPATCRTVTIGGWVRPARAGWMAPNPARRSWPAVTAIVQLMTSVELPAGSGQGEPGVVDGTGGLLAQLTNDRTRGVHAVLAADVDGPCGVLDDDGLGEGRALQQFRGVEVVDGHDVSFLMATPVILVS